MNIFVVIEEYEDGGSLVLGADTDKDTASKLAEKERSEYNHTVRVAEVELTHKRKQAIAKPLNYEETKFRVGTSIEDAVEQLRQYASEGRYVHGRFNGIDLYSDTVTLEKARDMLHMPRTYRGNVHEQ
jgi:hypothetical protein